MTPWKACTCSTHVDNVAIVTRGFMEAPEPWQIAFVRENGGKLACFECGGEVKPQDLGDTLPDHVTGSTLTRRLRELGVL